MVPNKIRGWISSSPTGAKVIIDNESQGTTPMTASLKRKEHHTIRIEMAGYQPYETKIIRKVDGWIIGNIIFGGLIGLGVDAITGGMYKLTPDQIESQLQKSAITLTTETDQVFVTFVLEPEPSWEKIGQLKRTN